MIHGAEGVAMLSVKNLRKTFPNGFTVINNFNIDIEEGSFTVLVGPSGCGKTTLIRMIAGLEPCNEGEIWLGGKNITGLEPGDRSIAMVFQNYALYPHMTVEKNITYGMKNYGIQKNEREKILAEVLELVGLTDYAKATPFSLSGGQRQRVALARAISKKPELFLMDEPLSNLDARLRIQMRSELIRLHQKLGVTFIYITHDQVEAMTMGDYIAVMDHGAIMQYGTPDDVYNNPANVFTAKFIGDPGMNIIALNGGRFLGFRSSKALFEKPDKFRGLAATGKVSVREHLGELYHYAIQTGGAAFEIRTVRRFELQQEINIFVPEEHLYFFDTDQNRMTQPHLEGATILCA
jgi:sn-glycerol 3-phosphate transport system ATP-binding protein